MYKNKKIGKYRKKKTYKKRKNEYNSKIIEILKIGNLPKKNGVYHFLKKHINIKNL
jgi:hypothetical protein